MSAGRILLAAPSVDDQDRGAGVAAQALRDAGFEVIYTGLLRRPDEIATAAVQEDVHLVALSSPPGAHFELAAKVLSQLETAGAGGLPVVVAGPIPDEDAPALLRIGIARVFPAGAPLDQRVADVRALVGGGARTAARPAPGPRSSALPPLAGLRVLDLTRFLAGPHGTQLLAQLGAEVIKVETPKGGDTMRALSRHFQEGLSAHFASSNASKKSVTLDLQRPEGRSVFLSLVARADVVMESYRPGTLARLGLDYAALAGVNPRIVLGSISGFGQTGPWRDWASFDLIAQAAGGGMSLTGMPGQTPVKMGVPIGDLAAGLVAALGVVAAVYRARATGRGEAVDVSMMDVQLSLLTYFAHYSWASGQAPGPEGHWHPSMVPYQIFATPTGYLAVAVYGDRFWPGFCRAIEMPELIADPRFARNELRCAHRKELEEILAERLASRPREDWVLRLADEGVPVGPVYRVDEALASPQAQARRMVRHVKGPRGGDLELLGCPIRFATSDWAPAAPPTLGQHTDEVLRELCGYDRDRLDELRRDGVI